LAIQVGGSVKVTLWCNMSTAKILEVGWSKAV